jgi:hypothetical protein
VGEAIIELSTLYPIPMYILNLMPLALLIGGSLSVLGWLINGVSRTPRVFYPIVGLTFFIFSTQLFSQIFDLSVPTAGVLSICFAILLKLAFQFKNGNHKDYKDLVPTLLPLFITISLITFFGFFFARDWGAGNFDFITALQDARFLEHNHSLATHFVGNLVPLNWSAGIGSRYDISFILSLVHFISPSTNYLLIGESTLIVVVGLGLLGLYGLLVELESIAKFDALMGAIAGTASSLSLLACHYQMFGQLTAIPVVYLCMHYLSTLTLSWRKAFVLAVAMISLFLLYPSILVLIVITIGLYSLLVFKQKGISFIKNSIKFFIGLSLGFVGILLVTYRTNPIWPLKMLLAYVTPEVQGGASNSQRGLFSQFISSIGPSQFLGLSRYPFASTWNFGYLVFVDLLAIALFSYIVVKCLKSNLPLKKIIGVFLIAAIVIASFATLKSAGYVDFKVATWINPLFWAVSIISAISLLRSSENQLKRKMPPLTLIFVTLLFNVASGYSYLSKFKSNTSFPQLITIQESKKFSSIEFSGNDNVAISAPTAEDSSWVAMSFPDTLQPRLRILGPQDQALGIASKTNCDINSDLKVIEETSLFFFNPSKVDIFPKITFTKNSAPLSEVLGWQTWRIKNIDAAVLPVSGLFPPTLNSQIGTNPVSGAGAIRWSSGHACFMIYSNRTTDLNVKVKLILGPDVPRNFSWVSNAKVDSSEFYKDGFLLLHLNVLKGWNPLTLRIPIGSLSLPKQSLLGSRADERLLVFAIGKIEIVAP